MDKRAAFAKITASLQKGLRELIALADRDLAIADNKQAIALLTKMRKQAVRELKWYERRSWPKLKSRRVN